MSQPSIATIATHIRSQQARCGSTRVILIDGPAGAGKTTLAHRLVEELGGAASPGAGIVAPSIAPDVRAQVLHGDDMYEGWEGLATLNDVLCGQVLEPLARGEVASGARERAAFVIDGSQTVPHDG